MKNHLKEEIADTKTKLLKTLDQFSEKDINAIPFEGSWTVGQVAEHVLKSAAGVLSAITGDTRPADRDPEQNVKPLADAFLNFNSKFQSPDFIIPSDQPKEKEFLVKALDRTFEGIEKTAGSSDLSQVCTTFEMPVLGYLTRSEFINFTVFHTTRHIHQLEKIAAHIKDHHHDHTKPLHQL